MARPAKPLIVRSAAIVAALEIIDAEGLEAFSVPRLAAHMGVRAPSLYHHFRSKNEILRAAVGLVAGTAIVPTGMLPGPTWPEHFVALAVQFRLSLLRYRNVAPLLLRYPPRDLLMGGYEAAIEFLDTSGVPKALHIRIVDGMETLAVGSVLSEAIDAEHHQATGFRDADPVRQPMLAAAVRASPLAPEELFETKVRGFLLGVVLDKPNAMRY
ncbi:TetR family transcriptional regulator [Mycolicibacterium novocastrense]|uniref:TetR family transcriptional regulator n=1 Tax=Mycolicibacterium novocastrense TaxID=59813 RepID=UPI00074B06EA|nr:TetR family transcriptional regulator [Mycolicibacterium novocastrense]KUH67528.1 TetR family transcriptional regulator [Mycolicibacterium novocastrense]KUH71399.1 TetR family transcriptional regulator [Mycolicibacterium novocastrense]KUH73286.1 TetR family transcriptional regulator [Mycolicibacterium novocastrense]